MNDSFTTAVVVKGWPRLSETFIAQELRELERRGLRLRIYSLRWPTDRKVHPVVGEIAAPVAYLPEYLWRAPLRVLKAWRQARRLPGYRRARAVWLGDLRRDLTPNRVRRFGQAMVLATEMPPDVRQIYAHFIHTPGSVARYAATMRVLPWSVSAHAKDIWTTPDWELREKLEDARWAVTCTAGGRRHLAAVAPGAAVHLAYHGLDGERFAPAPERAPSGGPVVLLSVGRAVAKKGYEVLLAALALLPAQPAWRFVHIGGGPLRPALEQQAQSLGLSARIEWHGAQAQPEVLAAYRGADIFVLASRIDADGDRDGLPNVVMEAMSQRVATISSTAGAAAELIEDGVSGLLVPPDDPAALAAALARLIREPVLRRRLAAAGEKRVRREFTLAAGIERIAGLLEAEAAGAPALPTGTQA